MMLATVEACCLPKMVVAVSEDGPLAIHTLVRAAAGLGGADVGARTLGERSSGGWMMSARIRSAAITTLR